MSLVMRNRSSGFPTRFNTSHRRWLKASNFGFRKQRDCPIHVAKTKVLISCTVTAQLICVFVFAYARAGFLITRLKLSTRTLIVTAIVILLYNAALNHV